MKYHCAHLIPLFLSCFVQKKMRKGSLHSKNSLGYRILSVLWKYNCPPNNSFHWDELIFPNSLLWRFTDKSKWKTLDFTFNSSHHSVILFKKLVAKDFSVILDKNKTKHTFSTNFSFILDLKKKTFQSFSLSYTTAIKTQ